MRRLYQAADRIEAQRLVDHLRDQRIPAVLLGDYLSGATGELPADIYPTVWIVQDGQWARARELLEGFLSPAEARGEPWVCPNCGETVEAGFEVCWNCSIGRIRE